MIINLGFVLGGLILLVLGGRWLLDSSVQMSMKLHIPKIIVGLTVVSFATSAPELIVCVKAAISGYPDIAIGNVIGSNIGNIGLVLGTILLINGLKVERNFYITDWPIKMFASLLLFVFIFIDGNLSRMEGGVFFTLFVLFLVYLVKTARRVNQSIDNQDEKELEETNWKWIQVFLFLVLGGFSLWLGSELLVKGAVDLASQLGVSERVIAVTVVSIGTSIPELASSVMASLKNENDISIGNILGSNIFNILNVLGVTALIHPIEKINTQIIEKDIYWMLGFAFLTLPLVLFPQRHYLKLREGILLLTAYVCFIYFVVT